MPQPGQGWGIEPAIQVHRPILCLLSQTSKDPAYSWFDLTSHLEARLCLAVRSSHHPLIWGCVLSEYVKIFYPKEIKSTNITVF